MKLGGDDLPGRPVYPLDDCGELVMVMHKPAVD
jgi:hypothetical protein